MLAHMIQVVRVIIFDRQLARALFYFLFLYFKCAGASPRTPFLDYPEQGLKLPTAEQSEARMRDNAVVPTPTPTLELAFNGGARKAWWWYTAQRAELTEVPTDQHTTTPFTPSLEAALRSEYSQQGLDLPTPHLLQIGKTAVMDEAASLEARISSMYHLTPGWTQLDLSTPSYTLPFGTPGPTTSQQLPYPCYRTLNLIYGEWPPKRLADTTHTPFINHNSNFPGHTFTVNGTLSVATCAFGYPKEDHCPTPTPTSETHFRLLNNERDTGRLWEPAYPRATQETFLETLRGTNRNSSTSKPSYLSNRNNETDSLYPKPKVAATDRMTIIPQNPKPTPYQWSTHTDSVEWYRTKAYMDLETRTMANGPIDQKALTQVQSPLNTLEAPFVLIPRPIDRPLGGDWREYCYSALVESYPTAAIFELNEGVLEDYDGNRWEFRHDPEEHYRVCLQRVRLTQEWNSEGVAHTEKPWDVFEVIWVKFNNKPEFWVCPDLRGGDTIGIGNAGWSTLLSLF